MAQGDISVFNSTPARLAAGRMSLVSQGLYVVLINNERVAKVTDTNPVLADYTTARAADAPGNDGFGVLRIAHYRLRREYYKGEGRPPHTKDGPLILTNLGNTINDFWYYEYREGVYNVPAGDQRIKFDLARLLYDETLEVATFKDSSYVVWNRIPGMKNVYQALVFDSVPEDNPCICFVDMTEDGGTTPFNLSKTPVKIKWESSPLGTIFTGEAV